MLLDPIDHSQLIVPPGGVDQYFTGYCRACGNKRDGIGMKATYFGKDATYGLCSVCGHEMVDITLPDVGE